MEIRLVMKTARSVSLELDDGGIYKTKEVYRILVNGDEVKTTDTVITSLYGLKPDTDYEIGVEDARGTRQGEIAFRTDYEFVTLDVRKFGAKGDGVSDDTTFIQAAIMACPPESRVLIPAGTYKITSLFLKSGINVELVKGAELLADTDRSHYAILPGLIESYDETGDYNLGTWEGNPLPMFAGIISGIDVSDVTLYGEGSINGAANHENWWKNEKVMVGAFRPRMLSLNRCRNIRVQGLYFHDSPAWVIHPYFSDELLFCNLIVENPAKSPNTDGLDPESCRDVTICGVRFSLGDDCIAVKSGKIYMGRRYKTPSSNIHVYQCLMEHGHGAVTVGSEMAGGVNNLIVEKCRFYHTDRGLRIKTRRGRGKDAILDNIIFRDLMMEQVMTPFTANAFYFCDPDGHGPYVQCRDAMPVDEYTPKLGSLTMEDIVATDAQFAGCYFDGLPEQPIERVSMKNVTITFDPNAEAGQAAMADNRPLVKKLAIYAENVKEIDLHNVKIEGYEGERLHFANVGHFEED